MADSSFDLSARITADASGLVGAASQGEASLLKLEAAEKRLAAAGAALDIAQTRVADSIGKTATEQTKAAGALASAEARIASARVNLGKFTSDAGKVEGVSNRQAFAVRNLGQQFGDLGTQVALGGGFFRAFASQAGQVGYALSEFERGPLKSVGAFLTGPFGIALTVATTLLAPLIGKLFEAGDAATETQKGLEAAATAADSFGTAQTLLGKIVDLTTGKFKTQNAVLIQTIKLQAQANLLAAQADQRTAAKALGKIGDPTLLETVGNTFVGGPSYGGAGGQGDRVLANIRAQANALKPVRDVVQDYINLTSVAGASQASLDKGLDATLRRIDGLSKAGKLAGRDAIEAKKAVLALGTTLNDQKANQLVLDAINGKGIDPLLKPYARDKKPKKPKSTEARDEFGRDSADKIANIVGAFDEAPPVLDKTNAKIRELDDLIEDLGRKKPPGFEDLIAKAEAAKVVVRDGLIREVAKAFEQPKTLADKAGVAIKQLDAVIADLNANKPAGFEKLIDDAYTAQDTIRDGLQKPFNDFLKDQRESLAVQRLVAAGRVDEASALRTVQSLQATMGPLTQAQKDAILASVQALHAEADAIDDLRAKNAKYLEALGSIRGVVDDATQAFVRGDLGQLLKSPGKLVSVFQTLQSRALFDRIFSGAFKELQDEVNGTTTAKDAAERFAATIDDVSKRTGDIVGSFKPPIEDATAALGSFTQALGQASAAANNLPANDDGGPDIVVTGQRLVDPTARGDSGLPDLSRQAKRDPETFIANSIGKLSTGILGAFTKPDNASRIGGAIGRFAGKGIAGAAEGAAINTAIKPLASALGLKTSSTGAQIGGAAGSFIPIPGGREIGALVGSIVGGLFKTTKTGSATLGAVNGSAGVTGTSGNNAGLKASSSSAGSAVADSLNSVVQQLGGTLGNFAVSIGQRDGKFVVDNSGRGSTKFGKANDGITAYKTLEEAQSAAFANAIADGAVQGLSAAMQRAFDANKSDVDKAVREALGVKALETALGGLGGSLKAIFTAEDAAAKERVRLAKSYGLDIVATEKYNAEQRAKLVDDTLKSRIGSLSDFLDNLKFGDLSEGSAADKRNALLDQIKGVQADAEAGKDGAADKLAQLYGQLVQQSRDAFGTAGGEYSSDRSSAQSGVERVIAMETDRVKQAAAGAQGTTDAVNAVAAGVSETNDLLAQVLSAIKSVNGGAGFASIGTGADYASVQRYA